MMTSFAFLTMSIMCLGLMSKIIKMALLLMTNNTADDSDGNFFFDGSDADDCEYDTLDDRDDANDVDA